MNRPLTRVASGAALMALAALAACSGGGGVTPVLEPAPQLGGPQTGALMVGHVWLLVPRILILFWIYQDQGITIWFQLHAIALIIASGGGSRRVITRRRVVEVDG